MNRRKGDFAAAIRSGRDLPGQVLAALNLKPGDRVLHLLCNDGREAAALSFHHGVRVDGVDFSAEAVDFAQDLDRALTLGNTFQVAEVYAFLKDDPAPRYDHVLMTPGSVRWLPDLRHLFELCARWLAPAATLTVWDFHPLRLCIDDDRRLAHGYPLAPVSYLRDEGVRDYAWRHPDYVLFDRRPEPVINGSEASRPFHNPHPIYVTEYGIGSIVEAAVADGGLAVRRLVELGFSWEQRCFPWLVPDADGAFSAPDDVPQIPLTFLLQMVAR
jgi:SAM-dependent methyltransferase